MPFQAQYMHRLRFDSRSKAEFTEAARNATQHNVVQRQSSIIWRPTNQW